MNIHYVQHVPYEGPGSIELWSTSNGHKLTSTQIYKNEILPEMDTIDWLVIIGGPMNIYQEDEHGWLVREKNFIGKAIEARKIVVGICLGAQLIADTLGARVYRNSHKEIGWFPIAFSVAARQSEIFGFLPAHLTVFHWHGDTFDITENALLLASSEACQNQAFLYDGRVIGLQFHLESTHDSVQQLVENCRDELVQSPHIQSADEILMQGSKMFKKNNDALSGIFNRLAKNQ
ncbi:MAG: type 1 glutamine amidotransferase [Nitrospiraceae bacterium]|nr:MAG: type 1 glutamine amidotransferase [Nitrospiraceae bacterium]